MNELACTYTTCFYRFQNGRLISSIFLLMKVHIIANVVIVTPVITVPYIHNKIVIESIYNFNYITFFRRYTDF